MVGSAARSAVACDTLSMVEQARPRPPTNLKAMFALGAGVASIVIPLLGVLAIVLGVAAVRELRRAGGRGTGQAIAGIALGTVSLVLLVLALTGVLDRLD